MPEALFPIRHGTSKTSTSGVSAHRILRNSVSGVSAHPVRQKPTQKLQNRKFCVVLKILLIVFNTPKSEVLRIMRRNSKSRFFLTILCAKTPVMELLRIPALIIIQCYYTGNGVLAAVRKTLGSGVSEDPVRD